MKRRILCAICALLLLSVLTVTAFAVDVLDFDRRGSITLDMIYQGTKVPGGSLTLYRVADAVKVDTGYAFAYTEEYAGCQVAVDDPSAAKVTAALSQLIAQKGYKGTVKSINKQGKVTFSDLELGLYLLIQEKAAPGYNAVSPFLVSVPNYRDEHYIYDVDASPKLELERAPTEPPTEPTTPSKLPQTGLTQWPIPVLAICGLLLVVLGLMLYTSGKKKSHED